MEPFNYVSQLGSPNIADSYLQGLTIGSDLKGKRIEQEAAQAKLQAQQAAQEQALEKQRRLKEFSLKENPTAQDYSQMMIILPELSEGLKRSWEILGPAQKDSHWNETVQVYAATQNNKPEVAAKLLNEKATALENSGDTAKAEQVRKMAQLTLDDPEYAKKMAYFSLHSVDPERAQKLAQSLDAQATAAATIPGIIAKTDETRADVATKNSEQIGRTFGALQNAKNLKPSQVVTAIKNLAARGVIPKDQVADMISAVPENSSELYSYLESYKMAGISAADQMKYTTPDANTVANNATSRANTAANNATQLKAQGMIGARQDAKNDVEASLDTDSLETMAAQYLAGDKSVMQNLGRGAQGAANIVALRKEITRQAKDAGLTGPQIAAKMADYAGLTAGIRTSANISARVENAISEAKELAPLAIAASKEVSRSGLLPFGKAQIMFNTQTNDPKLKAFVTANNGLVTAYGGAMARGQKPTVSDYEHARDILATAQSQEAYEATVNQMYAEMEAASRAPQNVREHLRGEISGGGHSSAKTSPKPMQQGLPAGWSVKER